ncbi:unnamed protein product [Acanthoscelides obtectus]|uniref:Uncharacterized protein n=1 Tax=Acanthoscelides obtectus TaxID=200917 RepID=A0A9P0L0Q8_ACAOB|nr:unnamed protein product [Acanthoscelides obtectus]CAK1653500.1 hypothetical protein AOBTE_LOCUS18261 [Acanthoscelides obtectus]
MIMVFCLRNASKIVCMNPTTTATIHLHHFQGLVMPKPIQTMNRFS